MNAVSRLAWISVCSLALAAPARVASAEGGDKGPVKKAAEAKKEAHENVKEKRKELKEKAAEARGAAADEKDKAKEEAKEAKEELKEARKDLKEAWAKLRETRKERRKEHKEALEKKWGDLDQHPALKAELKVHAWRMARLKRIRAIADNEGKKDTVARVDKLIEKEQTRHQKRMDHLKSKGGAP